MSHHWLNEELPSLGSAGLQESKAQADQESIAEKT
jgi:hypothetical protein